MRQDASKEEMDGTSFVTHRLRLHCLFTYIKLLYIYKNYAQQYTSFSSDIHTVYTTYVPGGSLTWGLKMVDVE